VKDNCVSIDEFWDLVISLKDDASRCLREIDETPEEDVVSKVFWRRMYARAVFALIETTTYRMTYHAYMARERPGVMFTPEELERLTNAYDFKDDPDASAPVFTSRKQFLDDIEFAFRAFARVHEAAYLLPIHRQEWGLMKGIARLRQDYQYCRTREEAVVYPENVDTLVYGLLWFVECMVALLESCADSIFTAATPGELEDNEAIM